MDWKHYQQKRRKYINGVNLYNKITTVRLNFTKRKLAVIFLKKRKYMIETLLWRP